MKKSTSMHNNPTSILLVEDDEFTASLLQFILERHQMQVTRVPDGRAALTLINEGHPCNAMVLDWMLPQISGLEVLQRTQLHPDWTSRPVLVLSAMDDGAEIARAFQAGAADYLTKPFSPEELMARLRRCLKAHEGSPLADRS